MAAVETEEKLTMTVEEAAEALGIGRSLAYDLARRGELGAIRLGKRLVIPRARLLALLEPDAEKPAA